MYDPENEEPVAAGGGDTIYADTSICLPFEEDVESLLENLVDETGCRVVLERETVAFKSHWNVMCFVEDPDGHPVEFIERLEGPPPDETSDAET